ncbi:MAG TPA: M20/M25/M40 family metallo-hydrolase [Thermoanaerobaculia bacterium]|nr:M20/M25/M40 family metallo-hydrolase [Thermoanaerobaculia bacterium]
MTALSRNARRRLALYGGAAAVALLALGVPRLVSRLQPAVKVRPLIAEADAAMEREATKLLVELVRIDTSNPPGRTREAVLWLAHRFGCEGIPFEIVGDDPMRPILVARLRGAAPGDALLLMNHIDVAPGDDLAQWTKPPFAAERGDEKSRFYLYGRGTLDMKGQAVAGLLAMAELKRHGIVPKRDVVFLAESAEESYEMRYGVGWVLEHRPDLLAGVTDALNEGGVNEVLGAEIERYGIEVMQKAIVSAWIESPSKEKLQEFRKFLEKKDEALPAHVTEPVRDFLRFIAPSRSDVWGRVMLGAGDQLTSKKFLDETPEVYRSLLRDAIYAGPPGPAPGGGFRIRVVRSLLPGSSVQANRDELAGWAAGHGLSLVDHVLTADTAAAPAGGRAWSVLDTVLRLDPFERAPVGKYILNGSFTSSSLLRARGVRALGFSPFNINFTDASKIHAPNERISLPHFVEGVERMRLVVFEYALGS